MLRTAWSLRPPYLRDLPLEAAAGQSGRSTAKCPRDVAPEPRGSPPRPATEAARGGATTPRLPSITFKPQPEPYRGHAHTLPGTAGRRKDAGMAMLILKDEVVPKRCWPETHKPNPRKRRIMMSSFTAAVAAACRPDASARSGPGCARFPRPQAPELPSTMRLYARHEAGLERRPAASSIATRLDSRRGPAASTTRGPLHPPSPLAAQWPLVFRRRRDSTAS